ncbi:TRAP transporter substrate-binding protein DctP [Neoroseomonas oryzicola]|uniref:C4-dicarboxylate ABC transporter n=1 Tax=Neoroseomonas oryzicola TaxID=535904 RepID=A0A9X9WF48_9PROT|nr:TRAP transporter substrate-binding protein DctP [Neoroseomonas oryzicola]MBR0658958.1 C4-dicarboxylate ABC transporter [Neoroseomonas oryzicola]NKE19692.1 TRAP transporter substrate-binding protein DctP [Neoroseomonas oryzicola]
MRSHTGRRSVLTAAAAALAAPALPALAQQARRRIRFTAVFSDQDIRAEAMRGFQRDLASDFDVELHLNATLFRQGTELVAIQRGNVEMANLAPQDFSRQIPAWSVMASAYLFRDVDHMNKVFASPVGEDFKKMVRDQLNVQILGPLYFGTRHVNLKPRRRIATPADMAGIKLRMPPGETWQFLGEALGANPTPVAFAELYTALQTGTVDGQDNPLPTSRTMRFNEVTTQFVLTSHLVAYDLLSISSRTWDALTPAQRSAVQAAADKAIAESTRRHLAQEQECVDFFKSQGLEVYVPNLDAFRAEAQRRYLASSQSQSWPAGILDRINAIR